MRDVANIPDCDFPGFCSEHNLCFISVEDLRESWDKSGVVPMRCGTKEYMVKVPQKFHKSIRMIMAARVYDFLVAHLDADLIYDPKQLTWTFPKAKNVFYWVKRQDTLFIPKALVS